MPDGLDLEMNPDGKTEEHGFLVVVAAVPFPYGPAVTTGRGTTVAVETTSSSDPEAAALIPAAPVAEAEAPPAIGVAV